MFNLKLKSVLSLPGISKLGHNIYSLSLWNCVLIPLALDVEWIFKSDTTLRNDSPNISICTKICLLITLTRSNRKAIHSWSIIQNHFFGFSLHQERNSNSFRHDTLKRWKIYDAPHHHRHPQQYFMLVIYWRWGLIGAEIYFKKIKSGLSNLETNLLNLSQFCCQIKS